LDQKVADPAMECGDWTARNGVTMMGLSRSSAEWWEEIKAEAEEAYQRYMVATPIKKLEVEPFLEDRKKYIRLRAKATLLLLEAIPKTLSDELVSSRGIHPTQILFGVMTKFQPRGLEERCQLLTKLEEVNVSETAEEAVKKLVTWERRIKRAEELKLTIPDSSRLMSALMKMVAKVLSADSQLEFRVQLSRSTLEADLSPTKEKLCNCNES